DLADGLLGVAAGGGPQVGHDAPADPGRVDPLADGVDEARGLAAGDRGRFRRIVGDPLPIAGAERGVGEVDARGAGVDADLAGAGLGVGDPLVPEYLGAAELVLSDGVHVVSSPCGPVGCTRKTMGG